MIINEAIELDKNLTRLLEEDNLLVLEESERLNITERIQWQFVKFAARFVKVSAFNEAFPDKANWKKKEKIRFLRECMKDLPDDIKRAFVQNRVAAMHLNNISGAHFNTELGLTTSVVVATGLSAIAILIPVVLFPAIAAWLLSGYLTVRSFFKIEERAANIKNNTIAANSVEILKALKGEKINDAELLCESSVNMFCKLKNQIELNESKKQLDKIDLSVSDISNFLNK